MNDTVVLHTTSKPTGAPSLCVTSLWYDETKEMFYSGMSGGASKFGNAPAPLPLALWSFKPDGTGSGSWNERITPEDSRLRGLNRSVNGYTASGGDIALIMSGVITSLSSLGTSDSVVVPGLVEFNMITQEFSNSTLAGFTVNGTGSAGQMHFVSSFGPQGVFLAMGGADGNLGLFTFDNVWIYESTTHKLYNQTTTGNIPEGRMDFCVAGINSTEGTYEM